MIKDFASQAGRFKISSASDKKLMTVTVTSDLFGSILFHALQAKVDMGEVLQYPLNPLPLSLCHPDGSMRNTAKSKLLVELENCHLITLEWDSIGSSSVSCFLRL